MKEKTRPRIRKEVRDWALILSAIGILYFSGMHREVIGGIQRLFLHTGIFKASVLDEPLPLSRNAVFTDSTGLHLSLKELEDKVVFLNIWATWCPPCIAEMPDLQHLYDSFNHEDLVYIFLSTDDNWQTVTRFMKRKDFDMPVYFPAGPLPPEMNSRTIPTTYLIDRDGRIVMQRKGMAKYNSRSFKRHLINFLEE